VLYSFLLLVEEELIDENSKYLREVESILRET
jgi:hypothetical protein